MRQKRVLSLALAATILIRVLGYNTQQIGTAS